jgi:hypothetical protein
MIFMKSDRRHELQTNELANWLGRQYERHQGNLPTILWGVLAVVALVVLFGVWTSRSTRSAAGAWEEFYEIGNADAKVRSKRLRELADKYPNTEIALWARLDLADQLCYDGHSKLDIDREIAKMNLREAQQNYTLVLENGKALPEMKRRAAMAEAKCWELLGEREKAIESYRSVAKQFSNTYPDLAADAASRASELEQPEAADFYKWLAEYTPPTGKLPELPGMNSLFPPGIDMKPDRNGDDDSATPSKGAAKPEGADTEAKKSLDERPKSESDPAASESDSKSDDKPAAKEKSPDPDAATTKPVDEKKSPEPSDGK